MEQEYIADIIEEQYKSWYNSDGTSINQPILISAGTGKGKTYFILHILLKYCAEKQRKILYFVNRLALQRQLENEITELPEDMRQSITLVTYQAFAPRQKLADLIIARYGAVIFDGFERNNNLYVNAFDMTIPFDLFTKIESEATLKSKGVMKWKQLTVYHDGYAENPGAFVNCRFIYKKNSVFARYKAKVDIKRLNEYHYIVFDEIHYLLQDALFNFSAFELFKILLSHGKGRTCHIYITATPFGLEPLIDRIEFNPSFNHQPGLFMRKYKLDTDYSYIKPHLLASDASLIDCITGSGNEKWLLFVDSIERGKALEKTINEAYENVEHNYAAPCRFLYRTAGANKAIQDMQKNGIFNGIKCLISTSILDNGIDIKDENFRHMVLITWDSIEFLQMVGRKRIKDPHTESLDLYLIERSDTEMKKHLDDLYKRAVVIDEAKSYKLRGKNGILEFTARYCNNAASFRKLNGLVKFTPEGYEVNLLAEYKNNLMIYEFKKLIAEHTALTSYQLSLLGIEEKSMRSGIVSNIRNVLEKYVDKTLTCADLRIMRTRMEELLRLKTDPVAFKITKRRGASPAETPNQWLCSLGIPLHIYKNANLHKGKQTYTLRAISEEEFINFCKEYNPGKVMVSI